MAEVILTEQTLSFAYDESRGAYVNNSNPSLFLPSLGETYVVGWDGVEYSCVSYEDESYEDMILIGNTLMINGVDTGEPFIIASKSDGSGMTIFTTETAETHSVYVNRETEETVGVDIVLYDRTGAAVTYNNADTLTTDTPDEAMGATFTYGKAVENAEYELDFSDGNQKVALDKGNLLKEFTLVKPENLAPEYIKKNINVAGVVGEFAGDEMEKTVELDMTDGDQVIDADPDTVMTRVTVKKPDTLVPENIPKGIEIAGVKGTRKPVTFVRPEEYLNSTITAFDADVTLIGASAFSGCASLLTVSVPECKVIETSAFYYCSKLKSIYAPKCEFLGPYALELCSSLTSLSLPLVTTLRNGVFCSQISDITVGCLYDSKHGAYYTEVGGFFPTYLKASQIKQVFDGSIVGANNFYVMKPPRSTSYASFAFSFGYYSQINLTFPYSDFDTSIPYLAFANCTKLSEVRIRGAIQNRYFPTFYWSSSGYRDMGSCAFESCPVETLKLLFRDTMRFGQMVFSNCTKLSRVYLIPSTLKSSGAITAVPSNIFYNTPMSKSTYLGYYGSIYAPSSIVEILKTKTGWSLYAARMVSLTDDETAALIEELEY